MSLVPRQQRIETGTALAMSYSRNDAMLSKQEAQQILEAMKTRAPHAQSPLRAQEIDALILLEVDSLVNADDREMLRFEGVVWSPAEK